MSRWTNKNRAAAPTFAFPLDSLAKEKENTNRPVAARSAGTVGKWGTTSFTSIRTPSYGYAFSAPAPGDGTYTPHMSPQAIDGVGTTSDGHAHAEPPPPPKLKKFFKSRNTAPPPPQPQPPPPMSLPMLPPAGHQSLSHLPSAPLAVDQPGTYLAYHHHQSPHQYYHSATAADPSPAQRQHHSTSPGGGEPQPPLAAPSSPKAAPKIRLKINKRQLTVATASMSASDAIFPSDEAAAEVAAAVEHSMSIAAAAAEAAAAAATVAAVKPPAGKARKTAGAAKAAAKAPKAATIPTEPTRKLARSRKAVNYSEVRSRSASPVAKVTAVSPAPVEQPLDVGAVAANGVHSDAGGGRDASPSKEHPPIKLRIFKGTAQLVRTEDSADAPADVTDSSTTTTDGRNDSATTPRSSHSSASPPAAVQSPPPPPLTPPPLTQPSDAIQSTAELLAVLTDDRSASPQALPSPPAAEQPPAAVDAAQPQPSHSIAGQPHHTNCIKIKIKTNYAHMISETTRSPTPPTDAAAAVATASPPVPSPEPLAVAAKAPAKRATRARKTASAAAAAAATVVEPPAEPSAIIDAPPAPPTRPAATAMDTSSPPAEAVALKSPTAAAQRRTARQRSSPAAVAVAPSGRSTRRNNTNANVLDAGPPNDTAHVAEPLSQLPEPVPEAVRPPVVRSYARKRKAPAAVDDADAAPAKTSASDATETAEPAVPESAAKPTQPVESTPDVTPTSQPAEDEPAQLPAAAAETSSQLAPVEPAAPSVKLVISKKKGSIFKSRATAAAVANDGTGGSTGNGTSSAAAAAAAADAASTAAKAKRHQLYRHKWDHDATMTPTSGQPAATGTDHRTAGHTLIDFADDDRPSTSAADAAPSAAQHKMHLQRPARSSPYAHIAVDAQSGAITAISATPSDASGASGASTVSAVDTRVRNVKKAHQIQEIGEYQEMDDDVDYILDALQPHNPTATRCLAALQLATKCMTPAFRMHVRAHGTITEFFRALRDAPATASARGGNLALCTAAVMFVLNQDNLNMDLDRDSLGLMLALLEAEGATGEVVATGTDESGLSGEQRRRNADKVRELCADIKALGKAAHLRLPPATDGDITAGTLAMETLLSLTAKRTGEWFKEEMRVSGGLERVMRTVCECGERIAESRAAQPASAEWTATLVERLRRAERCLRVVENVSTQNEENQRFLLQWRSGEAWRQLVRLFALCDRELTLYARSPVTAGSAAAAAAQAQATAGAVVPREAPCVVLREVLVAALKVLINLTHPFGTEARGSEAIGTERAVFATSAHVLLHVRQCVDEQHVFELNLLVLLLLMNLTTYTEANRRQLMGLTVPLADGSDSNELMPQALIGYFYQHEEMAQQVEKNTDAELEPATGQAKSAKGKSQEEVEETVAKLIQKAGNHMDLTMLAAYAGLVCGYLIMDSPAHQLAVRRLLRNGRFAEMVVVLEKYYTFMNLTNSSEASVHAHIKQTKTIMEYFKRCDKMHSGDAAGGTSNGGPANGDHAAVAAAVAVGVDPADDSDVPLTVTRPSNAPAQYRSSRRAAANAAAAAAAATGAAFSSSDSAAPFKPYR